MNDQAECQGSTARVWNVVTGEELVTLPIYEGGIRQAVWNADESQILAKSDNGTAQVWGVETSETTITATELLVLYDDRAEWNPGRDRILTTRCDRRDDTDACTEVRLWTK